ncbi:septum formation initiator family protein [Streptomyces sediminimaris]|uniref:septum formation initiator family protein n=1 Tax=Streptomyces sediminimaris TaxID=3383721 RepID=UPI0039999E06
MSRKPELRGRAARLARLFPGPANRGRAARTPFVLLVVLLLGGGLIGLLLLNSAVSEGSFKLDDLQKDTKSLTDEQQALQRDIDSYSAPEALQRRARELGMVPGGDPAFLGPDGTVKGVPSAAAEQSAADRPLVLLPPEALASESAAPGASPAPTDPSLGAATPAALPDRATTPAALPDRATTPAALPEQPTTPAALPTPTTPTPGR